MALLAMRMPPGISLLVLVLLTLVPSLVTLKRLIIS